MKKFLSILFLGLFILGMSIPSFSDDPKEYHDSWITSCGQIVYRTFPYELTDEQCADMLEELEAKYCPQNKVPVEDNDSIQP